MLHVYIAISNVYIAVCSDIYMTIHNLAVKKRSETIQFPEE